MATAIKKNRWLFVLVIGFVLILGFLTLDRLMPASIPSGTQLYEPYVSLQIRSSGNWMDLLDPSERLTPVKAGVTYSFKVQGMLSGAPLHYVAGERSVGIQDMGTAENPSGRILLRKSGSDKYLIITYKIPDDTPDGNRYSIWGSFVYDEVSYSGYTYPAGTKGKMGALIVGVDPAFEPENGKNIAGFELLPVFLAVGLIVVLKKRKGEKPSLKRHHETEWR